MQLNRPILLIAYDFPPVSDAGVFRATAFAKYLPQFGFAPVVVTRCSTANRRVDPKLLEQLPETVRIERIAFPYSEDWNGYVHDRLKWVCPFEKALKLKQGTVSDGLAWRLHRSFPGLHLRKTWTQPAVQTALRAVDKYRPEAIIATAPPFESFEVGYAVSRQTGIPLILDFRDPFTYGEIWHNLSPRRRRVIAKLERRFVESAARIIVVTPSMLNMMVSRYEGAHDKVVLITNGFDDYLGETHLPVADFKARDRMTISHIGTLATRRWPSTLFKSLQLIREQHPDAARSILMQFVGACHFDDGAMLSLASELGISSMVEYLGLVSYPESQRLMRAADALLLFEPTECHAYTGKLFEYIGAKTPIIGMVPRESDAAELIARGMCGTVVDVDDPQLLAKTILEHWQAWSRGERGITLNAEWSNQFHRRVLTKSLAHVIDDAVNSRSHGSPIRSLGEIDIVPTKRNSERPNGARPTWEDKKRFVSGAG